MREAELNQNRIPPVTEGNQFGQPGRISTVTVTIVAVLYMILIISAEGVTIFVGALPGAIMHALILFSLVNLHYFSRVEKNRQIYIAFALLPLLRILSLAMPVPQLAPIFWYVIIGLPLLLSVILVVRFTGLQSVRFHIPREKWINQFYFGLCGLPLGGIASLVLKTEPILGQSNMVLIVLGGLILTIFSAVIEEVIFRGILQKALSHPFGFLSFAFSSLLYASMFLGTLSPAYVVFYGVTGLLFSLWVQITDSLWGVMVAHSLMNIVFLLLFPLVR